jgi:hypothetical protein
MTVITTSKTPTTTKNVEIYIIISDFNYAYKIKKKISCVSQFCFLWHQLSSAVYGQSLSTTGTSYEKANIYLSVKLVCILQALFFIQFDNILLAHPLKC